MKLVFRLGLLISGLALAITAVSCTAYMLSKDPKHFSHYPATRAAPIDGKWVNAWNEIYRIEEGRAWDLTNRGVPLKFVVWEEIVRVAPGRYRARGTGYESRSREEVTISIVAADQIVARTAKGDVVFTKVKLNDKRGFQEDWEEAQRLSREPREVVAGPPEVEITSAVIRPALLVPPGSPFQLVVEFIVKSSPTGAGRVPLAFTYSIQRNDETLFMPEPTLVEADVALPQSRIVELTAGNDAGRYTVEATLKLGGSVATRRADLLVGDRELLLDQLTGRWERTIPGDDGGNTFSLERDGNGLRITPIEWERKEIDGCMKANKWDLELREYSLVTRIRYRTWLRSMLDTWYVWEDVIPLEGDLDHLAGGSTIVESDNPLSKVGMEINIVYDRLE